MRSLNKIEDAMTKHNFCPMCGHEGFKWISAIEAGPKTVECKNRYCQARYRRVLWQQEFYLVREPIVLELPSRAR